MKFVHLTPRQNLGRIKRHGLRMGSGRWGKGVYTMPLIDIGNREVWPDWSRDPFPQGVSQSTLTQWARYVRGKTGDPGRKRRNRVAAVIHRVPNACWPLDLMCSFAPNMYEPFLELLEAEPDGYTVTKNVLSYIQEGVQGQWVSLPLIQVASLAALGRLLHFWQETFTSPVAYDDLEIIVRYPIPSSCIESFIPLYRTNREFTRARREFAAGDE